MYELSLEASPGERTSVPRVELREARWRLREEDPGRDMLREDIASHAQDDLDLDLSAAINSGGARSEMSTFIHFDFVAFLRIKLKNVAKKENIGDFQSKRSKFSDAFSAFCLVSVERQVVTLLF